MKNASVVDANHVNIPLRSNINDSSGKGQEHVNSTIDVDNLNHIQPIQPVAERMGNPRKWLQSSNGVSNDSRSQSLPNCHNIKKTPNDVKSCDISSDVSPSTSGDDTAILLLQDSWFNTWPEKIQKSAENIVESQNKCATEDCDSDAHTEELKKKPTCSLTLNEALNSFSLAYNPKTKQLHHVESTALSEKSEKNTQSDACNLTPCENQCAVSPSTHIKGHRRTVDAGSFSSTVSSLSDPSSSGSLLETDDQYIDTNDDKIKRKGLTGFFSRKIFSSTGSWRLFGMGRNPSLESLSATSQDIVASSSALIQHERPATLPAKDDEEDKRHRDEYEAILQAARKREHEHSKARKKKQERQIRQEEQLSAASKQWSSHILPSWETTYNNRKTRDLWWQGLPPSVRGRIWNLAIGNELNITANLYDICVTRAQERLRASEPLINGPNSPSLKSLGSDTKECDKCTHSIEFNSKASSRVVLDADQESSMDVIRLDISRTFPNLGFFQEGGPYYQVLHELLAAYVCYRPDVGYVQGMSFLAAILILNMEPVDAFICFANLVNRPLMLAAFTINQTQMNAYYEAYNEVFKENLPKLYDHFENASLTPDLYLLDWIYTVYAKAMPLDLACRVWDVFLRDGDEFIFRTALGVLHLHHDLLLGMDFLDGAQFLTRLPDDMSSDYLFRSIKAMNVSSSKRSFLQLVEKCRENLVSKIL